LEDLLKIQTSADQAAEGRLDVEQSVSITFKVPGSLAPSFVVHLLINLCYVPRVRHEQEEAQTQEDLLQKQSGLQVLT
jgi:hypothetical protein